MKHTGPVAWTPYPAGSCLPACLPAPSIPHLETAPIHHYLSYEGSGSASLQDGGGVLRADLPGAMQRAGVDKQSALYRAVVRIQSRYRGYVIRKVRPPASTDSSVRWQYAGHVARLGGRSGIEGARHLSPGAPRVPLGPYEISGKPPELHICMTGSCVIFAYRFFNCTPSRCVSWLLLVW